MPRIAHSKRRSSLFRKQTRQMFFDAMKRLDRLGITVGQLNRVCGFGFRDLDRMTTNRKAVDRVTALLVHFIADDPERLRVLELLWQGRTKEEIDVILTHES